jgi:hypothetical protein
MGSLTRYGYIILGLLQSTRAIRVITPFLFLKKSYEVQNIRGTVFFIKRQRPDHQPLCISGSRVFLFFATLRSTKYSFEYWYIPTKHVAVHGVDGCD